MNKSRIEWCDHTLNIITGCRHGCTYCYARRMTRRFAGNIKRHVMQKDRYRLDGDAYILDEPFVDENGQQVVYPFGFEPTLHRYRYDLLDKLKMGRNIFVGAMADMFGDWVPAGWINDVIEVCQKYPQHNYLFLTKNAERFPDLDLPADENIFFGTSITREEEMYKANFLPVQRNTFVSIEPILEDVRPELHEALFCQVDWVIIGAETGRRKEKVVPQKEWIIEIIKQCDRFDVPVFIKNSLSEIVGKENMRQEYPVQLQRRGLSKKIEKKMCNTCLECKGTFRKNEMVTLIARTKRGGKTRSFGYMCKDCFCGWCKNYGIDVPDLEELTNG